MSSLDLILFFFTVVALAVAPGPAVLLIIVRAASSDISGAVWFGIGAAIGSILIVGAVCLGLSAWFVAFPEIFEYSKYAMLAYITWIARSVWKGGFDMNSGRAVQARSIGSAFFAGFVTCFLSPYYMIMLPLMLPEIVNISLIDMPKFLIIATTTFVAMVFGAVVVTGFAAQLRRIARCDRTTKFLNRSLAAVLMVGGGWMALT